MHKGRNIVVAITAASGARYASLLLDALQRCNEVERIAVIFSTNARSVAEAEGVEFRFGDRVEEYSNGDMFASVASGSAAWDSMVVIPSSVGTVARIATGVSDSLICRAADVMLKERRRLIVVVREAPYSLIHLRNMTTLTEAGAVVLPASPSFYACPKTIDELCMSIVERVVAQLGLNCPHFEWGK